MIFIREYDVGPTVLQRLLTLNAGQHNRKVIAEQIDCCNLVAVYSFFNGHVTRLNINRFV